MPRSVAAQTWPLAKRIELMVVDSSSFPPTRSLAENVPLAGFARRYTPVPTYEVPPVFASPVAYQSEPSAAFSSRSPVESVGSASAIGVQLPPPCVERQTPPTAPP